MFKKVVVGTALACLLMAANAMADGQVTDPCGVAAVGTLPDSQPDPTIPWLDLCNTDIAGFSTSAGRGIKVTIHVAGDTDLRQSEAAYAAILDFDKCYYQLQYSDLGIDTTDHTTRLQGACNLPPSQQCDYVPPAIACSQSTEGGDEFDVRGSAALTSVVTSGGMTGSTITLTFDPSKLAAGAVPQAVFDGLTPGSATIRSATTFSFLRNGAKSVTGRDGFFNFIDWGYGDGWDISLG